MHIITAQNRKHFLTVLFLLYQVVQALHKCLLFDQGGFLDQPLFNRLLTPLTAQLSFHFPPEVATRELDPVQLPGGVAAAEGLDVFGRAAVEAVVQMAVSVRAEAMWKPLHHQVCTLCLRWAEFHHPFKQS